MLNSLAKLRRIIHFRFCLPFHLAVGSSSFLILPKTGFAFIHAVGSVHSTRLSNSYRMGRNAGHGLLRRRHSRHIGTYHHRYIPAPSRRWGDHHKGAAISLAAYALAHDFAKVSVLYPRAASSIMTKLAFSPSSVSGSRPRLKFGDAGEKIRVVFRLRKCLEVQEIALSCCGLHRTKPRLRFVFGRCAVNLRAAFSVACQRYGGGKPARGVGFPFCAPTRKETSGTFYILFPCQQKPNRATM